MYGYLNLYLISSVGFIEALMALNRLTTINLNNLTNSNTQSKNVYFSLDQQRNLSF